MVIWAAHIYANKDRRLAQHPRDRRPGGARACSLATGLVVLGNDLGTALVLFALLLGMLWVVGAPTRFFTFCASRSSASAASCWSAPAPSGSAGSPTSSTRSRTTTTPGWQPAHGLYALSTGGLFGQGIGASQQKWGDLPEAHTDFIFAVLGEELGLAGTLLVIGCS